MNDDLKGECRMKTEQEKYLDAFHKACELRKAINDLRPETRRRLLRELFQISTVEELQARICSEFQNYGKL